MRRIVSVWLPLWPIELRRRRAPASVPDDRPFALVEGGSRGLRLTAVSRRAAEEGLEAGMALCDARAALPGLATQPADPAGDRAALVRLARWCGRYGPARNAAILPAASPLASLDHGLWVDVAGVDHLYGGEAALIADITARLSRLGLTARTGLADTSGAAWALARHASRGSAGPDAAIAPPAATAEALATLPVAALRLAPDTVLLLQRLGLRRIGQLYALPRPALARRFRDAATAKVHRQQAASRAAAVLFRLDEVLGTRAEALVTLAEPPVLGVRRAYTEPLISSELLESEVARLVGDLCGTLDAAGLGVRRLRLGLYRADATSAEAIVGTSVPCRDPRHLVRLMREKLAALDAGFGIDALALEAVRAEPAVPRQPELSGGERATGSIAELVDRLANRLGAARVTALVPHASHVPERAQRLTRALHRPCGEPAATRGGGAHGPRAGPPRPPLLLARPEPIEVMAEVPEGAPLHFTWRRLTLRVVRSQGPERIAPEWWRSIGHPPAAPPSGEGGVQAGEAAAAASPARASDYYRVAAAGGGAYWVFRHGRYGDGEEGGPPRWFLHGLFG